MSSPCLDEEFANYLDMILEEYKEIKGYPVDPYMRSEIIQELLESDWREGED